MSAPPKPTELRLRLSASAARNLATASVTGPQMPQITPRWLYRLLPWVDGGVYRVNRVDKAAKGGPANEFGEGQGDLLTDEERQLSILDKAARKKTTGGRPSI